MWWQSLQKSKHKAMSDDENPCPKKRKGGQKQQMESAKRRRDKNETDLHQNSALAEFLESEFAWGTFSPQMVQKIASLAGKDMEQAGLERLPAHLNALSGLGSHGKHANNMHRDLCHFLKAKYDVPSTTTVLLPFSKEEEFQQLLLPHELFSWLYHNRWEHFKAAFMPGGQKQLVEFWKRFHNHPCMDGNTTITSRSNWQKTSLPISLHGDGVPVTALGKVWGKCMEVYSWQGLLGSGGTKNTTFMIWCVPCLKSDAISCGLDLFSYG